MAARAHQTTDDGGRRSAEEDCSGTSSTTGKSQKGESAGCKQQALGSFIKFLSVIKDYSSFFDQHKLNGAFPGYKVRKLHSADWTARDLQYFPTHIFRRPPEHNSSTKHKTQTLNVTEAIIQTLNNCMNVILDCLLRLRYHLSVLYISNACALHFPLHTRPKESLTGRIHGDQEKEP